MNRKKELEKEKNRKLSPMEEKRLARFEAVSADLEARGYRKNELTVSIVFANIAAILFAIPICAIGFGAYVYFNSGKWDFLTGSLSSFLLFIGTFFILIVVHELIHGVVWSRFASNGFKDIEFGFMKEYLTPYCTCTTTLKKGGYIMGALGPLVILGIIPVIAAVILGSSFLLYIGLLMCISAGGDMLIVFELLKFRSDAAEQLVYDHPTQAGCVVFTK